jgi:hypothetical protein
VVVVVSTVEALAVAVSTAAVVSTEDVSAIGVSMAVAFVVAVLVGATGAAIGAIMDSLMMSSSAASVFRTGGAMAIRTDITVTTITRTITMDTADTHMGTVATRTAMDTAGTVTTVAPVTGIATAAERVMDMAMAPEVTDTALAADQGMSGVRGVGDKPGQGSLRHRAGRGFLM